MRPVYGDSVLWDEQYTFGVRSLFSADKALLIWNYLASMLLRRPMPRFPQLMLSYGLTGTCQFQTLFYTLAVLHEIQCTESSTIIKIIFRSYAVYHLCVMIENWWRKWYTDKPCSMNRWRHDNDVIIKIFMYVQNKIPYKTYISDFSVSEFMVWRRFVTYLSNDPRLNHIPYYYVCLWFRVVVQ